MSISPPAATVNTRRSLMSAWVTEPALARSWRAVNNDTGWTTLTFPSSWTVYNNETPAVRRVGAVAYLRGAIRTGVAQSANPTVLMNLPAAFRPLVRHHWYVVLGGTRTGVEGIVDTDGSVNLYPQTTALPADQLVYINTTWLVGQ